MRYFELQIFLLVLVTDNHKKQSMKKLFLVSPIILLLLASCSTALYQPVSDSPSVSLIDLKKGRETYVNNCASCHQLYTPNKFSDKVWMDNLNEMQTRAKISDEEKALIYQYITNAPK